MDETVDSSVDTVDDVAMAVGLGVGVGMGVNALTGSRRASLGTALMPGSVYGNRLIWFCTFYHLKLYLLL
jgi:hypothetical protein